jgi:ion transport protein
VEAILKLLAWGPWKYFADGFNTFDFFIVVVSLVEVFAGSGTVCGHRL